ncbi:MAG: FHA domain-containing protein [Polyangiaceae bacterium]|jgi:pilus assembly protein CpaF
MFTIIISEKGGAERREAFDKNEINVGRVQGNDLMLPKGNVSKHHARLLFRDGRFIVTDLKSTNGTYVNGRKISQATIVREGDKIYIGDFVLRLETTAAQAGPPLPDQTYGPNDDSQGRTPARLGPLQRDATPAPPAPGALQSQGGPPPLPAAGSAPNAPVVVQPPPMVASAAQRLPSDQSVSHYPLERDPDDSESSPEGRGPAAVPKVPGPPRVPQAADPRGRTSPLGPGAGAGTQRAASTAAPAQVQVQAPVVVRSVAPPAGRALPRETPQQAARRLALITLVDRVADVVDLGALKHSPVVDEGLSQQIDRAVREQAKAMREEGEAPEGTDLELLARDALRELVGLGPIGPLLEDEETLEIHVARPDYVLAMKNGQPTLADPSFTSEEALGRVVARLAHQSGESWHEGELVIERRLARGAHMVAIAPPAASTWVLTVRKRRRVESTLEEMVRSGTMSRSIASFLEACLAARANVLVVGSGAAVVAATLGALASGAPAGERVAVLQDADEIAIAQAQVVALSLSDHGARGEESVRAASRLGADRLVVASLGGAVAAAVIDAIGEGCEGVLAGVGAPSLRHGLARLASQIALARPGASVEASREAVGESFDVAVEVVRSADGRQRVLRVAELGGSDAKGVVTRDLFVLSADGTGEGAYAATGVVPRMANDFAARGVKLDGGVFKRK